MRNAIQKSEPPKEERESRRNTREQVEEPEADYEADEAAHNEEQGRPRHVGFRTKD